MKQDYSGLGRRKTSVARVRLVPSKKTKFLINGTKGKEYLHSELLVDKLKFPLKIVDKLDSYDVIVNVKGGGISGQTDAIVLGIARALLKVSSEFRKKLKEQKLLSRDSRIKERKKPGLRKARRARQFSKR